MLAGELGLGELGAGCDGGALLVGCELPPHALHPLEATELGTAAPVLSAVDRGLSSMSDAPPTRNLKIKRMNPITAPSKNHLEFTFPP